MEREAIFFRQGGQLGNSVKIKLESVIKRPYGFLYVVERYVTKVRCIKDL
jgi:hypothetical protein